MLNGNGIENGKHSNNNNNDNNRSIKLAKKNCFARAAHHFYISLLLLLHHYNVKLSIDTFYGGDVCSHRKNCCLCYCLLSFSLALIVTLLAAKISHFLTTAIKLSFCVHNEIRLYSSFSVIHVSLGIKA